MPRLNTRPLVKSDCHSLAVFMRDPVCRSGFHPDGRMLEPNALCQWLTNAETSGGCVHGGFTESGELVCVVALMPDAPASEAIRYATAAGMHDRGFASETIAAVLLFSADRAVGDIFRGGAEAADFPADPARKLTFRAPSHAFRQASDPGTINSPRS